MAVASVLLCSSPAVEKLRATAV